MTRKAQVALWLLAPLAAAAAWVVARSLTLGEGPGSSICLFRRGTGIPCPGCGLTRAGVHLARGEWAAAVADHPLALLLAAEGVVAWLLSGVRLLLRGRPRSAGPAAAAFDPRRTDRLNLWVVSHVLGLVALWLGRMATGTLPW